MAAQPYKVCNTYSFVTCLLALSNQVPYIYKCMHIYIYIYIYIYMITENGNKSDSMKKQYSKDVLYMKQWGDVIKLCLIQKFVFKWKN